MRFREIIKQCITRYTARRSLFCCNEAKSKAMQKRYFHQRKTLKSMFILRSLIIYVMHINNNNAEEACNEVTSCIYYIRAHAKLLFSKMAVWSCWVFVHFMSTEQLYPRGPIGVRDIYSANQAHYTYNSIVNLLYTKKFHRCMVSK